jgi:glutamate carboxypeptidase
MTKGFVAPTVLKQSIRRLPWFQTPVLENLNSSIDSSRELAELREFVEVSSPSHLRAGVEQLQNRMRDELSDLGFDCRMLPHPEDKFAPFLLAEIKGRSADFVTLICHTDTVLPSDGFRLNEDGSVAYGSGVIDNKGGLVVMLSALRRYLKSNPEFKYGLRVMCSPNEEVGSNGYIPVYLQHATDTLFAVGMEPALENGSIICQRRGNRWYDIEVVGREAHAGRSQGEHVNAAHDLAKKITALAALNQPKKEIAVNIGHLQGGQDRYNIICGRATAKLDVRFSTLKHRDWLHQKIHAILETPQESSSCGRFKSQTLYQIVDDCPPVSPTRKALKMSQTYIQTILGLEGRKIKAEPAGGAGDVNYLSRSGVVVLDGFGPVGGEMHTKREFVDVKTLATRSMALAHFFGVIQSW